MTGFARRGSQRASASIGATATSLAVSFPGAATVNDLVVVGVNTGIAVNSAGVTDNQTGNTYTLDASSSGAAGAPPAAIFHCTRVKASGTFTVTYATGGAATLLAVFLSEYAYTGVVSLDQTAQGGSAVATTTPTSSIASAPSAAAALAVAVCANASAANNSYTTTTSGYNTVAFEGTGTTNETGIMSDSVLAVSATQVCAWNIVESDKYNACIVVYRTTIFPTLVNHEAHEGTFGGSSATITLTNLPTAGNLLVVGCNLYGTPTGSIFGSLVDNYGSPNTISSLATFQLDNPTNFTNHSLTATICAYILPAGVPDPYTLTLSFNSGTGGFGFFVQEWVPSDVPFTTTATPSGGANDSSNPVVQSTSDLTTPTTTHAALLFQQVCVLETDSTAGSITAIPRDGWTNSDTLETQGDGVSGAMAYMPASGTGPAAANTYNAGWSTLAVPDAGKVVNSQVLVAVGIQCNQLPVWPGVAGVDARRMIV